MGIMLISRQHRRVPKYADAHVPPRGHQRESCSLKHADHVPKFSEQFSDSRLTIKSIDGAMRITVKAALAAAFLFAGQPLQADTRQPVCAGHEVQWIGGAPAPRAPSSDGQSGASSAVRIPTHEDGHQPTVDEPAGLDREVWDAVVFDNYDSADLHYGYLRNQTVVLAAGTVADMRFCLQAPDVSTTGARLEPYSKPSWWRRQIKRWTNLNWAGDIEIGECTGQPPDGWVYVREGEAGEVPAAAGAVAYTSRTGHRHRAGRWLSSELLWNPRFVGDMDESHFEKLVAHELGHALGLYHAPPDTRYIMASTTWSGWPGDESTLTRLAYRVGPNVQYPGLRREHAATDSGDRAALMALYEEADGSRWAKRGGWGTSAPLGTWYGVTTNRDGRVVTLDVHENGLRGTIPSALGRLSKLESLVLSNNQLSGSIPASLGSLAALEHLDVSHNGLTGGLPDQLGELSMLGYLAVDNNRLTGPLPSSLTDLEDLLVLSIQDNDGLCAPTDVAFQRWLANVSFEGDFCEEVDEADSTAERAALMALYEATDGDNWLVKDNNWGTDAALGRWRGVETDQLGRVLSLVLNYEGLKGTLPPELGNLRHLLKLELRNNELTGLIPSSLGGLQHLEELDLSLNELTAPIPAQLTKLTNLTTLGLSGNAFTGPIPTWVDELPKLKSLWLGGNQFSGPIPTLRFTNLELLNLIDNQLTAPIPELTADRLGHLNIAYNRLAGSLPPSIGNLPRLEYLGLYGNRLTGPLPSEIMNIKTLRELHVFDNAGLCAPSDAAFQDWLMSLESWRGETCAADVPALPAVWLLVMAVVFAGMLVHGARRAQPRHRG